jgi:hypothetical protein
LSGSRHLREPLLSEKPNRNTYEACYFAARFGQSFKNCAL